MSGLLWALLAIVVAGVWWASSRSLVGAVPRNGRTEAALAEAALAVSREFQATCGLHVDVAPVWAHGCPCLRIRVPGGALPQGSPAWDQACARAAALLQDAVRHNPEFGDRRGRYVGAEGLHWHRDDTGP